MKSTVGAIVRFCACFAASGVLAAETSPISAAFAAWQRDKAEAGSRVNMSVASAAERLTGLRPSPIDFGYLAELSRKRASAGETLLRVATSAPSHYDLRTLGLVTPVRNQNPYGTCWAHASLASLESWLLKLQGTAYDFSVNNLVNLCGFTFSHMNRAGQPSPWDGQNEGGNRLMAAAYLLRWAGPAAERDDAYPHPGESVACAALCRVMGLKWVPQKTSALDNDGIKEAVQRYGAMMTGYYHDDSYLSSDGKAYCCTVDRTANHAVAIVGWDDAYPRTRFRTVPEGDGAYIVKNSWGADFGENGYFYVSYYDRTMNWCDAGMVFSNVDTEDTFDRIYQYDDLGFVLAGNTGGVIPETGYAANIFTASGRDGLSAVGFYVLAPNADYEVTIRTGVSEDDPGTGVIAATVLGTVSDAGFATIPLPSAVTVEQGTRFAVLLKLTTPGFSYPIPLECQLADYSESASASGLSFSSSDGKAWRKFSYVNTGDVDACIKVYAQTASSARRSAVPTSFAAACAADGQTVSLTWEYAHADATFRVYRSETNRRPETFIAEQSGCFWTDGDVAFGKTYFYWVTAKRSGDDWTESDSAATSVTVPQAPARIDFAKGAAWWPAEFYLTSAPSSSVIQTSFDVGEPVYLNLGWGNDSLSQAGAFKVAIGLRKAGETASLGGWTQGSDEGLAAGQVAYYGDYLWMALSDLPAGDYELTATIDPDGQVNGPLVRTIAFRMVKPADAAPDLRFQNYNGWTLPFFITNKEGSSVMTPSLVATDDIYVACGVANGGTDDVTTAYDITFTLVNSLGGKVWSATYGIKDALPAHGGFLWNANIGCRWNGLTYNPELNHLPPGNYTMRAELDSSGAVRESDENNNVASYTFTVRPQDSLSDLIVADRITFRTGGDGEWSGCVDSDGRTVVRSGFLSAGGTNWIEIVTTGSSEICFYQTFSQGGESSMCYYKDGIPGGDLSVEEKSPSYFAWTFAGAGRHVLRYVFESQSESACLLLGDFSWKKARTICYEPGPSCSGKKTAQTETVGTEMRILSPFFMRAGCYQTGWVSADGVVYEPTSDYESEDDLTLYPQWAENATLGNAVGGDGLDLYSSGDAPWIAQSSVTHDGVAALRCGNLLSQGESRLQTAVRGSGQLSFWWREDAQPSRAGLYGDGDFSLRVDNKVVYPTYKANTNLIVTAANSDGWIHVACRVSGSASHKIEWIYERQLMNGTEPPLCYLDDVVWCPDGETVDAVTGKTALEQGWSWISIPVMPTEASFANVFKGVAFADEDVIKSFDGSATYYGGTWYASPTTFKIVPGCAYAVKKSTAGTETVTVTGTAASATLAVAKGWNWIGLTSSAAVSLKDLKHSVGFTDEDVINSSGGSATYYGGTWYGSLESLTPGVGYKAKFGKAGTLDL